MSEHNQTPKNTEFFSHEESDTIMNLERLLMDGMPTSSKDIRYYISIHHKGLALALNIYHKIEGAENKNNEANISLYKMYLCEKATRPLFYGLINHTKGDDCFNEAPDRKNLAEYFNLNSGTDIEVLDKAIIHFLAGAMFFQGINYRYYGDFFFFDNKYSKRIKPENLDKTIKKEKKLLDRCLDKTITYKKIEKGLSFIAFAGEFDYMMDLVNRTLPSKDVK